MTAIESKTILVISQEESLVASLSPAIQSLGYSVALAHDGATVIDVFTRAIPSLIIIDMGMGADGVSILEGIRASVEKVISGIPVIIASQSGDLVEISSALRFGIQDYFIKSNLDISLVKEKMQKIFAIPAITANAPDTPFTSIANMSKVAPIDVIPVQVKQTKLLIVEDDKFLRDLASQKMSKEGLIVFVAVDGEQGIAMAEKELPDIILLDILLPGIDGFEVLHRVRANAQLANTRVAMLSNFGQREDIEKALNAGADQFLVKANYTLDEIVEEVKRVLAAPRRLLSAQ